MMFSRIKIENQIIAALDEMPAAALLGARQVGKTTLALNVSKRIEKPAVYLDLERVSDLAKIDDPEPYLESCRGKLLIIDEVQRKPNLFPLLRSIIDSRIRDGEQTSQFLILGSTSWDLLRQSSETLAGRIRFIEINPFSILELEDNKSGESDLQSLWLRGGFPKSFTAHSDSRSWNWRSDFIHSYVERDIPQMGISIPSTTTRVFWSMLAWENSQQLNFSRLGSSLGVSYNTIKSYLNSLVSAFVVRMLPAWHGNARKRLIKTPKMYLRDSGLAHWFLTIRNIDDLRGHSVRGASWEAFVVENILRELRDHWKFSYYRTRAGAEIDLILELPNSRTCAVEIKFSTAPKVSRGFYEGCKDVGATEKYVIYPGEERFPLATDIDALGITEFIKLIGSK